MFSEILLGSPTEHFENKRVCSVPWYRQIFLGLKRTIYRKNKDFLKNKISLRKHHLFILFFEFIHFTCRYNTLVIQKVVLLAVSL